MPLYLDRIISKEGPNTCESSYFGTRTHETSNCQCPSLTIGLINNMQDGALEATERQFMSLLSAASEDFVIRLRLYQLPGIVRGISASSHVATRHSNIEQLWGEKLDGLVVTGREPSAALLQDEPYWDSFGRLLEWAHDHTLSTIWSCLAAHAAVLQMDGICRVRSTRKHCGVFDCDRISDHSIMAGMPTRVRMPHSRWNGLEERQLVENGYEILTRSERVGVDTFVRENNSLFLFIQGHPEYETINLLLEYRRDVARYLRGDAAVYPSIPQTYFDDETTEALREIGHEARLFPREELLAEVSAVLEQAKPQNSWHTTAASIYRNWLHYLAAAKKLPLNRPIGISETAGIPRSSRVITEAEPGSRRTSPAAGSI